MSVEHIEVLVEEPSMEAALRIILPKILNAVSFEVYPHRCKNELLTRLPARLQGYARWIPDGWRIVVVVDRDADNCNDLKAKLEQAATEAGFITRSNANGRPYVVVNRIAIEELEAWYFGDWEAVRSAFPKVPPTVANQAKYRNSDDIAGGTWEAFERILKKAGYFENGLRKIEAARQIAYHMELARNTSPSFQKLNGVFAEMSMTEEPG
jgi:hypothetical protein